MSITVRFDSKGAVNFTENNNNNIVKYNGKLINAVNHKSNSPTDTVVETKRKSAGKLAMKLISDAWKRDEKALNGIDDMIKEKQKKMDELDKLDSIIGDIENEKKMLKEEYGIDDDSKEQKDLELLEKYQDNKMGASFDSFSDEEKQRLRELQNTPLTEYQRRVLEINGSKAKLNKETDRKKAEIFGFTQSIVDANIEQLKSRDMGKAKDAADAILDASGKDIIGLLVEEGKEHIDDVWEEEKELQEDREERLKETKERREEQEKIIEGQIKTDKMELDTSVQERNFDNVAEVQKIIEHMIKDKHLINEDLKGIEIDLDF